MSEAREALWDSRLHPKHSLSWRGLSLQEKALAGRSRMSSPELLLWRPNTAERCQLQGSPPLRPHAGTRKTPARAAAVLGTQPNANLQPAGAGRRTRPCHGSGDLCSLQEETSRCFRL